MHTAVRSGMSRLAASSLTSVPVSPGRQRIASNLYGGLSSIMSDIKISTLWRVAVEVLLGHAQRAEDVGVAAGQRLRERPRDVGLELLAGGGDDPLCFLHRLRVLE